MNSKLISHSSSPSPLDNIVKEIIKKIKKQGDKPYASIEYQLDLLIQLQEFEFGRYLLTHQGMNGYWTNYLLTHPWVGRKTGKNNQGKTFTSLELFLLDRAPAMLATQERFTFFLRENQKAIKEQGTLACIPCGLMGELLYLDYQGIQNIICIGIDYDVEALNQTKRLAEERNLAQFIHLQKKDAWSLNQEDTFDLISSNGLNIYESDHNKVTDLYRNFYKGLKQNGKLVTSFLTYPPDLTSNCEWDLSKINQHDLVLQKIIFVDLLSAKWRSYRSSEQTYEQLDSVGFRNIEFIYDKAKIFPSVIAYKI